MATMTKYYVGPLETWDSLWYATTKKPINFTSNPFGFIPIYKTEEAFKEDYPDMEPMELWFNVPEVSAEVEV